jgi:site-specific DNA-methyltransferase (adenine-specific)/modification methylase
MIIREEVIGNCTLYLGDCRDVLPAIEKVETVVTDPVWPNNSIEAFAHINPYQLFADAWGLVDTKRAAIQMGCDSDPALLRPITLPFVRVVWLEYALPGYKGRILYSGDVAYLYGEVPRPLPGKKLIPGKCVSKNNFGQEADHPCPRKLQHVKWLTHYFSDPEDIVLDPFMGSGTTGVACVELGRKFIGIEINEQYFDVACKRIKAAAAQKEFDFGLAAGEEL